MMARTGPNPPEPHWLRLDERGLNSSRHAWGYLSPDEKAVVSDQGKVFMLIDEADLERLTKQRGFRITFLGRMAAVLKRCLRWSRIVQEMFSFDEEAGEEEPFSEEGDLSTPKRKPKLVLKRPPRRENEWR